MVPLMFSIEGALSNLVPSGQFTGFTLNYETAGFVDIHLV